MTEAGRNIGSVFGKKHQNFARYLLRPLTRYLDHHHIYMQTIGKILTNSIYFDKQ